MIEHVGGCVLEPVDGQTLCRSTRKVSGRVRPKTSDEVVSIVRDCNAQGLSYYAVSTGKNWGFGSFLPSRDCDVMVDLSRLKTIGPLDLETATIRIEAGVTQRQLYEWLSLNAPKLALNVTGSGADTSILGNALERGLGYFGSREHEIFGLEVILSDGTRSVPDPSWFSSTGITPVGPDVDSIFSQSNFGIVTSAWFRLHWKQELQVAIVVSGEIHELFPFVVNAFRKKLLSMPVHLAGGARSSQTQRGLLRELWAREPSDQEVQRVFSRRVGSHTAICAVHGQARVVNATLREMKSMKGRLQMRSFTANRIELFRKWTGRLGLLKLRDFISAIRPLLAFTWGEPSDAGIAGVTAMNNRRDPDKFSQGCIYLNAVCPLDLSATQKIEDLALKAWPSVAITQNFLSSSALVNVLSLNFSEGERDAAHAAAINLGRLLRSEGFPPYRLGLATMDSGVSGEIGKRLKEAFNPERSAWNGHHSL